MADRVGQSRSSISNYLRLLKLPAEIQVAIRDKQISMGHARALVSIENIEDQLLLLKDTIEQELSVREVEERARVINMPVIPVEKKKPAEKEAIPEKFLAARDAVARKLGTKVQISRNVRGRGAISITFRSDDEFKKILSFFQNED
jgi:ParB family chromosome partitioning protein